MHYQINNYLVKSENAALSSRQTNSEIISRIDSLPNDIDTLDYGCGKCRYSRQLSKKSKHIVLLDSKVQLTRQQIICDEKTTVEQFAKNRLKNATIIPIEKIDECKQRFDFILCTNVISATPVDEERTVLLHRIRSLLKETGKALISVQYYNSYFFAKYNNDPKVIRYFDGWLIPRGKDFSFYGIIKPPCLAEYCVNAGLSIVEKKTVYGTAFFMVEKQEIVG